MLLKPTAAKQNSLIEGIPLKLGFRSLKALKTSIFRRWSFVYDVVRQAAYEERVKSAIRNCSKFTKQKNQAYSNGNWKLKQYGAKWQLEHRTTVKLRVSCKTKWAKSSGNRHRISW